MYDGLLGLHSLFRWLIMFFLVICIARGFSEKNVSYSEDDKKWATRLLLSVYFIVLIGVYQYFFGPKGFAFFNSYSFNEIMRDNQMRFWAVEHISGMILATILITIGWGVHNKDISDEAKRKRQGILFFIAFLIILAVIPWPFRPGLESTPLFRGLSTGI